MEQCVEVGITAIGVEASLEHIDLDPAGGVTKNCGGGQHEPLELFRLPGGEESRSLQRPQLRAYANGPEVVVYRFGHQSDGWERGQIPGIKSVWIASLGEQALRLGRVVRKRLQRQGKLERAGDDGTRHVVEPKSHDFAYSSF